ncbi:MAG: hypothetical protein R6V01_09140 [Thermoplasmatota archaeon]
MQRVELLIIAHDREMTIASKILLIKYLVRDICNPEITVVDNGSGDRTAKLARKCGSRVLRFSKRMDRSEIIERSVEIGRKRDPDILVTLDVKGENPAEDAASLIRQSLKQGDRFASAYVLPVRGDDSIGCWAMSREMLEKMTGRSGEIASRLLEVARSESLELETINEHVEVLTKKRKRKRFHISRRGPLKRFTIARRNHPLMFYGFFGMITLLLSMGTGAYVVVFFYNEHNLHYLGALTTIVLVMISGFLLVAGLMLNAMNQLAEKLEAMKKWV